MSDLDLETPDGTEEEEREGTEEEQDATLDPNHPEHDDESTREEEGEGGDDAQASAPQLTPEARERRTAAAEKRFKTYRGSIASLYGADADNLTECPLCPDQHKGFVDVTAAGYVPQEVQDACNLYFGLARERQYKQSRDHRTCDNCDGEGKIRTGSNVPEYKTEQCGACGGRGYVGPPATAPTSNGNVTGPTVYTPEAPASQAYEERDEWDEARILPDGRLNPNFGKMPNRKILVEPWGQTAGLNAFDAVPS